MSACKMCGKPSYVDPANQEDYGHCVECIIGTFGQTKDMNLLFAAPELLKAIEDLFEHCAMIHKHWGEGSNAIAAQAAIAAAKAAIAKAKGTQ